MTLKKTLIAILFCIPLVNSFTQTEQETIDWLNEKFEKYSSISETNEGIKTTEFKISACNIIYENTTEYGKVYRYEIPTINITLGSHSGHLAPLNEEKIISLIITTPSGEKKPAYFTNTSAIYFEFNEPNLEERILKALKHLNTFCEKEAF